MILPHLEELAAEIHAETCIDVPVDMFVLAEACGVECRPTSGETGFLAGDLLYYPEFVAHVRQQGQTGHEMGHWVLRDKGLDASNERHARYLAGALMLPAERFVSDLRLTGGDLTALRAIHVNASAEMIAVRMTQLGGRTVSVWEKGTLLRTYGARNAELDIGLVVRTLESGLPVRAHACAYPIFDGSWRRVIVIG